MKPRNFSILGLAVTLTVGLAAGCGKSRNGTYVGTENIMDNGSNLQSQVSITLNDGGTGTWTSQSGGSGNLTYQEASDSDSINVTLTMASTSNGTACPWTGVISVSNDRFSGTLSKAGSPQQIAGNNPQQQYGGYNNGYNPYGNTYNNTGYNNGYNSYGGNAYCGTGSRTVDAKSSSK